MSIARKAARGIVIKDDSLLVMYRNKFGQKYVTLPGGGIDVGETPEEALMREIAAETSVVVADPRLVIIERAGLPYGDQLIYTCTYQSGEPRLSPESEEYKITALGKNLYEPGWLPLSQAQSVPFLSEALLDTILEMVDYGWPDNAVEITTA